MKSPLPSLQAYVWNGGRTTFNFAVCARLSGSLHPEALRGALAKAQQRHPMLRSRVVMLDGQPPYLEIDDTLKLPLRVVERQADDDWAREVKRELATPMNWRADPLIRFVLIQTTHAADLIFTAHHSIADGMSAYYVLRDVLAFLAQPDRVVESLPLRPGAELLLASGEAQLNVQTPPGNATPEAGPPPSTGPFHAPGMYGPRPNIHLSTRSLTQEQTAALANRSRTEGTTVHGAICAALLQAHVEFDGIRHAERVVSFPVNRRAHLTPPVGEDVGLYFDIVSSPIDCGPDRHFWDIARDITARLRELVQQPGFFQTMIPEFSHLYESLPYAEFMRILDVNPPTAYDISVTNIGRLEFADDYGGLKVESVWGPAVLFLDDEKTLGVATAAGVLTMTLTFNPAVGIDVPTAEAMMDYAVRTLTQLP